MFQAQRGGVIILVVTMVTVIGILGSGFFGAGMRAVQEREENILRRFKVTPITPVPLLLTVVAPPRKFVPVNVTGTSAPWNPDVGLRFVNVGEGGSESMVNV